MRLCSGSIAGLADLKNGGCKTQILCYENASRFGQFSQKYLQKIVMVKSCQLSSFCEEIYPKT
jgi:hypothetical protein